MSNKKILLVDDEADFRELIGVRIRSWGYDLIEAASGKEAISALKNESADIIILDYLMPQLDGIQTLKQVRKISKDIPVIMFTAHADMPVIKGAQNLGIAAFIPKLSAYTDTQSALKTALDMVEKELDKQRQGRGR